MMLSSLCVPSLLASFAESCKPCTCTLLLSTTSVWGGEGGSPGAGSALENLELAKLREGFPQQPDACDLDLGRTLLSQEDRHVALGGRGGLPAGAKGQNPRWEPIS